MLCDLPSKILVTLAFDLVIHFMTNLRRTPGHFFVFLLFTFTCTLAMSGIFRTIGAASRTLSQAMAPASVFILALMIYTGFTLPIGSMHPWFRWINYLNPIAYAFESLMVNEFHDRRFPCTVYVPMGAGYQNATCLERICSSKGAQAGASFVDGDAYINTSFDYYASHLWRWDWSHM
jgi:ABC-type multidrug transport system permease subunit